MRVRVGRFWTGVGEVQTQDGHARHVGDGGGIHGEGSTQDTAPTKQRPFLTPQTEGEFLPTAGRQTGGAKLKKEGPVVAGRERTGRVLSKIPFSRKPGTKAERHEPSFCERRRRSLLEDANRQGDESTVYMNQAGRPTTNTTMVEEVVFIYQKGRDR